ncbi:TlpA disulfide reductase family protein [Conexibacter sp. JD483]|uniref:TlpA family protein disulfide reductase n=1 Tax=unclassified Conexibacter TaxID=2627773 RepID=UPI002718C243|nr:MULTISPECIES: TlpA disulfide reductase family protein [unclassified Conexibacter]MDO8188687.1 TlpA disulfide reductase family protein [Conexibacter sp. CPCC 205706]MDO8201553.1 TlpA disulfide reductase family protein [Conexibacter sp. CPCC 205762]MDR9372687.1 TlpA disulfide reductase family protein [Conexibacter sp. JD483]
MRRLAVPGLVAVLAIGLVALLIFGVLQTTDDSSIDQAVAKGDAPAAPSVVLSRLAGDGSGSLADYRGRVVLVNFFASWCAPCDQEAPLLNDVQRTLAASGGTVLGVAVDDTRERTQEFVTKHGVRYPILRDIDRKMSKDFELKGLPETFLVDAQGRILALERQQITRAWIDRTLDPTLARLR